MLSEEPSRLYGFTSFEDFEATSGLMGACRSRPGEQDIEPFIAMWVMKVQDFLSIEVPLPKHEELLEMGLLHERQVNFYCIFISHQWLGLSHPDPEGRQQRVLQECLDKICHQGLPVRNDASSQFLGEVKTLSSGQRAKIRNGYLWLDWISIPQIETYSTAQDDDDEIAIEKRERSSRTFAYTYRSTQSISKQEEFILSIPSFVQACQVFVACAHHFNTWTMARSATIARCWDAGGAGPNSGVRCCWVIRRA